MINFVRELMAAIWNRISKRRGGARSGNLDLGFQVVDGDVTRRHVTITPARRSMHLAVLGKTGSGKSSLLRHLCAQDIAADRGFVFFDLHGDTTPFLLRTINARERQLQRHLSDKLVLIEPADPVASVGLNPLALPFPPDFVRVAEFAEVLKAHWALDRFGARTDELLRNTLYALAANGLTLVEVAPFLSERALRIACLKRVENAEIRSYFETRYDPASDSMQAVMREPILNKTSAFTADPRFRHIVGQARSTFSLREALDNGYWIIANLDKGRLGEQAVTFGTLLLTMLKNALFARERRSLVTLYCDEIHNFVALQGGIETILSEARKFGVAVVTANQFLNQCPPDMQAALFAVGTPLFFQLSSVDASPVTQALDGGARLAQRLKSLPARHFVLRGETERWREVKVPDVSAPGVDYTDLVNRSRNHFARARVIVEREITERRASLARTPDQILHEWE